MSEVLAIKQSFVFKYFKLSKEAKLSETIILH